MPVMTTTLPPPVGTALPPAARRPVFGVLLGLFRVLALLHAVLALAQPVSIGLYLDGRYGLLQVHQAAAGLLVLAALTLGVVALGYVLGGGRLWALGCVPLFLAEGIQTGMGYSRSLSVHVPLGVAVVALAVVVAVLAWTPAAGRPRAPRRRHRGPA
ncbi:hypothetical protein GCM10009616_24920 [Microlunatus lacustris]